MSGLITRLDLDNRLRTDNIRRFAIQSSLGTLVVLILLVALDAVTQTVLIAALGATTFVAFATPRSPISSPRCLIGGYIVGIIAGSLMSILNTSLGIAEPMFAHMSLILFGALATGIAMFLMVVTKTEHSPAAALGLGLVMNEWSGLTLIVILAGVVVLSLCKRVVLPHLMDIL